MHTHDPRFPRGPFSVSFLAVLTLAIASLTPGCSGDDVDPGGEVSESGITFTVDDQISPRIATVPGFDGAAPRPVAAVADGNSQVEFVERELLVSAPDRAAAEAIAARWEGRILAQMTPDEIPDDLDHLFVIRLEEIDADASALEEQVRAFDPEIEATIHTSSLDGLRTLAAAAIEANEHGTIASPNWLLIPQSLLDGQSREHTEGAPSGAASYDPDATQWPYLSRYDEPRTGVEAAWQMIEARYTGDGVRRLPKTAVMILDGGFIDSRDMPENTEIYPFDSWKTKNPVDCSGGNPCPWHGLKVASTAFAVPDNDFGTAGVAAQTSLPMLVQTPGADFGSFVKYIFVTIPRLSSTFALGRQNTIINISGGAPIPGVICLTGICRVADEITRAANRFDILIVTSAGNEGKDVDEETCVVACWETTKYIPCELGGVLCVGGLAWNDIERHPNSNWGSDGGVDIYGPYQVWVPGVTADPAPSDGPDPEGRMTEAGGSLLPPELGSGTSYSSPFVAGVASLVWSSRPSLKPQGVVQVLLQTARGRGAIEGETRVDAMAAVARLLGPFDPVVEILNPADGEAFERVVDRVNFDGIVADPDALIEPDIEWRSDIDGLLGHGRHAHQSHLSVGNHTITLSAEGHDGRRASQSIQIAITNSPPVVQILPADGSHVVPRGEFLQFEATVSDRNSTDEFPDESLTWTVDGDATDFVDETGRVALLDTRPLSIGDHTVRVEANDGDDVASDEILIEVTAPPAGNQRPTAYMVSPLEGDSFPANQYGSGGSFARVELCGWGLDPDGPDIKGPEVVWYARRVSGGDWTLVATNADGEECTRADLFLERNRAETKYEIRMLVTDADGATSATEPRRTISVVVNLI